MADITYNDHASKATPTVDDFVPIWDVAASQSKKATLASIINARLTGGGIIATGGHTLTVPATGTAALLGEAQTFTGAKTFTSTVVLAPASVGTLPLQINSPAAAASNAVQFLQNSVLYAAISPPAWSASTVFVEARDDGAGPGPAIEVRRNSNGTTSAAGRLVLHNRSAVGHQIWPDNSGNLRIGTTAPNSANDTSGTVVGAQTSMAAAKHISDGLSALDEVIARVQAGAEAVRRFTYRSGAYNKQEFEGVVVDDAPDYGMDRDDEHPAGKSLNEIQIMGDLLRAVAWLTARVRQLEEGQ